jgi:ribosomal protein S17E
MKQGVLNHHSANQGAHLQNGANAFIAKGPNKVSFAKEMSNLQNANELIKSENLDPALNQNITQEALTPEQEVSKFKSVLSQALANKGMDFDSLAPEVKEKLALMQDAVKQEAVKRQGQDESNRNAEDLKNKFSTNETTAANVSQENQKQITDAVREGNVAQQEQAQDKSDQRKQQLANWEDLAPRVVEDPKNRAVRIDIPGLPEIETIIVRMNGNKVSIQTVGEGKIMDRLQSREQELVSKLSSHNISLDSLKTFDSAALNKGRGA